MGTPAAALLRAFVLAATAASGMAALQTTAALANGEIVRVAYGDSRSLTVVRGKTATIQAGVPVEEIVVGDPAVASVTPLSDNSFFVTGLATGTTAVALFDSEKNIVASINVEVTLDTGYVSKVIRENVKGAGGIKVRAANGAILLSGSAKNAVDAAQAERIAREFAGDGKVINAMSLGSSQQVQLNVRIVEINRDVGRELGTRIGAVYATGGGSISFNSVPRSTSNLPAGSIVGSLLDNGWDIDLAIEALEDRGIARRLAEPNLVARSGETASFLAGGEFPIPVSEEEGRITVTYKKFGVGLDFTPTVLDDGLISLKITPEVSSIDTTSSYRVGEIAIPGFSVRRATTGVDLKSGQSFMIAGLLQSENAVIAQQVPGIAKLPIIGALFTSRAYQKRETDLVIIVTPYLVQPMTPALKAATPMDRTRPATDAEYFGHGIEEVRVKDAPGGHMVPGGKNDPFPPRPQAQRIRVGTAKAVQGHFLEVN